MKIRLKTQRSLLATLMVFAIHAIGLQSFVFELEEGCRCATNVSVTAEASSETCCGELPKVQKHGCCSTTESNATAATSCCCNPAALACGCGECKCSEDEGSHAPPPAIPGNETTEVVSPTWFSAAPSICFPRESEIKQAHSQKTVADYATLSSQQTCVLLSRFTC